MVSHDSRGPFQRLTFHLLNLGHRRILCLTPSGIGPEEGGHREHSHRKTGFRRAIEEHGTMLSLAEEDFFSRWQSGNAFADGVCGIAVQQDVGLYQRLEQPVYKLCKRLFASGKLPDAIVCMNDMYAMEAIMAAQELGVRIPNDVAVTGYDNDLIGSFPAIGLTTAEQDIENICSAGVEELVQRIADPLREIRSQTFDSNLILRTSCGRLLKEAQLSVHG
jgi:DNA-binding LacI/PurR family transcriptional regulator